MDNDESWQLQTKKRETEWGMGIPCFGGGRVVSSSSLFLPEMHTVPKRFPKNGIYLKISSNLLKY